MLLWHIEILMVLPAKIDVLLVPARAGSTNLLAMAGYPMVTMPFWLNAHSVPFRMALIGTAWSEPTLIKCGSAIDEFVKGRKRPEFIEWRLRHVPVNYSK
jgi:amidase